ncbi:putative metal-dependent hydrolase YcfH [Kordia antarctica]|uniref:Putative metal-dependent hydrolase YcfH n=2 Tax=Kordia antarctica TaxID=1218801 RepID=A0A7L4ZPH9_9FLAO|nr:putative metal-dependent hydrolase YcfH [Kordia antarctica]
MSYFLKRSSTKFLSKYYFYSMTITDTHTHLYSEAFDEDRNEMMQRAINSGVRRFFVPAIDSTYTERMFQLEKDYPNEVFLMSGLHPTHVKENYKEELAHVEALLLERKYYAVGEIGIDLYWDKTFLKQQQEAFQYQIQLAKKYKLPIVIHCRDAFDEVFEVLEKEKSESLFGIFHCFTGTKEQAEKAIGYNMKLGIGGVVTFKNGKIDKFLNEIPLEHIVLETDSPYLAPTPYRGKRNESSYVMNVLEKVSEIYQLPETEIASVTTENSKAVFGV